MPRELRWKVDMEVTGAAIGNRDRLDAAADACVVVSGSLVVVANSVVIEDAVQAEGDSAQGPEPRHSEW
jgi:hypothetical protein